MNFSIEELLQYVSKRCPDANVKNKHTTQQQKTEYLQIAKLLERKHIVQFGSGALYNKKNDDGRT